MNTKKLHDLIMHLITNVSSSFDAATDLTRMAQAEVVAHTAACVCDLNYQFCLLLAGHDNSTCKPWAEMTMEAQDGFKAVVTASLRNPPTSPANSHDRWVAFKIDAGWSYGEVACAETKVHPNIVPWGELSDLEKFKDAIFCTMILRAHALLNQ